MTEWTDTNEGIRNRWSEEGKGQVREGTETHWEGKNSRSDTWGLSVGLWGCRLPLPQDKNPPSRCLTTPYFKTNTPMGAQASTSTSAIYAACAWKWQLHQSKTSNDACAVLRFMPSIIQSPLSLYCFQLGFLKYEQINTFCSTQHPNFCVELQLHASNNGMTVKVVIMRIFIYI